MRNNLFRDAALLVAAVLLTTGLWSCSKNEEPEPTPPEVTVTGVTLNSIQVGGTETLTATVSPKDAANKKVTWKSSNAAISRTSQEIYQVVSLFQRKYQQIQRKIIGNYQLLFASLPYFLLSPNPQ